MDYSYVYKVEEEGDQAPKRINVDICKYDRVKPNINSLRLDIRLNLKETTSDLIHYEFVSDRPIDKTRNDLIDAQIYAMIAYQLKEKTGDYYTHKQTEYKTKAINGESVTLGTMVFKKLI